MKYKWIPVAFLVMATGLLLGFSKAEDDPIKKIAAQLEKWLSDYPLEKVHLHLDKPYYAAGEDMWFKAYVTVGSDHRLSGLSGILNIELVNDNDSIKQSLKLPLTGGLGWGDFALADSLKEGNYRIRAYTNWMRNAGEDYFFDKTITILNAATNKVFTKASYTYATQNGIQKVNAVIAYTDINGTPYASREVNYAIEGLHTKVKGKGVTNEKGELAISFNNSAPALLKSGRLVTVIKLNEKEKASKSIAIKAASALVDVQFFPEGGYLVNGAGSKVAFKAMGADGLGKDIKGVIKDNGGNTIVDFTSRHLGMGVFDLQPEAGKSYSAHITFADGSVKIFPLPAAKAAGYILSIDNSNPAAVVLRIVAANVAGTQPVSVVGQSGGRIVYAAKAKDGGSGFTTAIPKSRFASGIVQFTLFSATGEPLNERLIFVQRPDLLKLDIAAPKQNYAAREKIKLEITSKNAKDSVVQGSFSVSVIDESKVKVDENAENTIMSDLLLTSDLKGYIEKPNYYFNHPGDSTRANLDILMLTQGYRRFEWKQLLSDNFLPPLYQAEKTIDISGVITLKNKPFPAAKVTLFSSEGGLFTANVIADAQGRFSFKDLVFPDSAHFVIQATERNGTRRNLTISLDNLLPSVAAKNKDVGSIRVDINEGLLDYLKYSSDVYAEQLRSGLGSRTIMLSEVKVNEKKQVAKNSSNLNGAGNADQVLTAKDLSIGCVSLDICLQGRLVGVRFQNGKAYSTRGLNQPMLIVVDGMSLGDDYMTSINVNDVETIEVLRGVSRTAIYGARGYGGIIIITTKRGGSNVEYTKRPSPGVMSYSPKGYYVARAFYSPRYDDPKTNVALADLRSTIYWNPNIITDKQGNASVEYFNAGSKGTYRVVIEGIDNDGKIGRQVYRYKVE